MLSEKGTASHFTIYLFIYAMEGTLRGLIPLIKEGPHFCSNEKNEYGEGVKISRPS